MMLEQFGCKALIASDHHSALHAVSEEEIDLAIIDYHLADGETGEHVARDLRIVRPGMPIIMLTGDNKLPQSASDVVDEVIIKGAGSPAELLDLIQKLLPNAELRARRTALFGDSTNCDPKHSSKKAS
jgi:DNA-binding response OmpR family regulator